MMNYLMFKEMVMERFLEFMPMEYMSCKLVVKSFPKINTTLEGITLIPDCLDTTIMPVIYLNQLYDEYRSSRNFEYTVQNAAKTMLQKAPEIPVNRDFLNFEKNKEQIVFQLINRGANTELLKTIPYRSFHDLAIVYRIVVTADSDSIGSILINNSIMEQFGVDEKTLFQYAVTNTKTTTPPLFQGLGSTIMEISENENVPAEFMEQLNNRSLDEKMFILSNSTKINGAGMMIYSDLLEKIAEKVEGSYYILPSSVHEVLVVIDDGEDAHGLTEMVYDVNMTQAIPQERLSHNIYYYDRNTRLLTMIQSDYSAKPLV